MRKFTGGLLLFLLLSGMTQSACAVTLIKTEDRLCKQDGDCALVGMGCCNCGTLNDTVAANVAHASDYQHICTGPEKDICAQAGACVNTDLPVAVCRNHECVIEVHPQGR